MIVVDYQILEKKNNEIKNTWVSPGRVIFFPTLVPGSGNFQLSRLAGLGYGVRVLGNDIHNRVPNSNPNLNHNSNRNLTLTPILTPNSSWS